MAGHLMWRSEAAAVAQLDMLHADRLGVVRFDVSWQNMEPSPGHYMFIDKLDSIVASARARGSPCSCANHASFMHWNALYW